MRFSLHISRRTTLQMSSAWLRSRLHPTKQPSTALTQPRCPGGACQKSSLPLQYMRKRLRNRVQLANAHIKGKRAIEVMQLESLEKFTMTGHLLNMPFFTNFYRRWISQNTHYIMTRWTSPESDDELSLGTFCPSPSLCPCPRACFSCLPICFTILVLPLSLGSFVSCDPLGNLPQLLF